MSANPFCPIHARHISVPTSCSGSRRNVYRTPLMRHGLEIPTVRKSDVADVVCVRLTPTIRPEFTASAVGRPGDGEKLQQFGHLVTRNFCVYSTEIRVAQRFKRVHAVSVVQVVPVAKRDLCRYVL